MKITPDTPEEQKAVSTVTGMWQRIAEFSMYDPLTSSVLQAAHYRNLSKEDTAIFLAFEALKQSEFLWGEKLNEHYSSFPHPVAIPLDDCLK